MSLAFDADGTLWVETRSDFRGASIAAKSPRSRVSIRPCASHSRDRNAPEVGACHRRHGETMEHAPKTPAVGPVLSVQSKNCGPGPPFFPLTRAMVTMPPAATVTFDAVAVSLVPPADVWALNFALESAAVVR